MDKEERNYFLSLNLPAVSLSLAFMGVVLFRPSSCLLAGLYELDFLGKQAGWLLVTDQEWFAPGWQNRIKTYRYVARF